MVFTLARLVVLNAALTLVAQPAPSPQPQGREAALGRTVGDLYALISGPEGKVRDVASLRAMLHADAQHAFVHAGPDGRPVLRRFELEAFLRFTQPIWEKGFYEREVARRTEWFGHIAQVFSTYEVRLKADGPVVRRGINSFQFVHDGDRWRLLSALWEGEGPGEAIPSRYLR